MDHTKSDQPSHPIAGRAGDQQAALSDNSAPHRVWLKILTAQLFYVDEQVINLSFHSNLLTTIA
jgi:hypothetical protein